MSKVAFLNKMNASVSSLSKSALLQDFWRQTVDIGSAIVNVLGTTGIAGFKFNCPQREEIALRNEVTDHYTDANNPIQDHIASKPIEITLNGLHGEYFYSLHKVESIIAEVRPAISLCTQLLPQLSEFAMQQRTVFKAAKATSDGPVSFIKEFFDWQALGYGDQGLFNYNYVDLATMFQNMYQLKSAQTRAYYFFEALWRTNVPFSVETSWKHFDNMIITSVKPLRDNNADITDFTISFKQINVTSTTVVDLQNVSGKTRVQMAQAVNKGVDKGLQKDI